MNKKVASIVGIGLLAVMGIWYAVVVQSGRNAPPGAERQSGRSVDVTDVREATVTEIVDLKDGQAFDLAITPVRKTIQGKEVRMLAYNGSVPGPTLRVPEGAQVTINLRNDGDMPTTLHAHGVRMDNMFDGVPDMTQKPIAPGETFSYTLKFPDAGAFWYHPHVRSDIAVESGLYGAVIVTPRDKGYWPLVDREIPIMLDDIAVDSGGAISSGDKTVDHTLMGRFGTVMLANGDPNFRFDAKPQEVVRLYLTNASNARLFNFAIPGAKMKLVGADMGRYARETSVNEVLLAPGERRVVDVLFEGSGEYKLLHKTPGKQYVMGKVNVSGDAVASSSAKEYALLRTNQSVEDETKKWLDASLNRTPDKSVRLTLDMDSQLRGMMGGGGHMGGGHMMPDGTMMGGAEMGMPARNAAHNAAVGGDDGGAYEWEDTMLAMNAASNASMMTWKLIDEKTGKANMDIDDWTFRRGDMVKIRIFNDPKSMHPMQHPIHFHGQRFLVLATNGERNTNPVWQDTTLVAKGDTVDILLEASNPGMWMAHCHILEHAEAGMMLPFRVE